MRAAFEIRAAVVALLALQVITALGAVVLLARTGPAVERILAENDYSLAAAEAMARAIASRADGPMGPDEREAYDAALERARENITEAAEHPVIIALSRHRDGLVAGDAAARDASLDALRGLSAINRASMRRQDLRAKQLATGGAWAVVVLAGLALFLAVLQVRRANRRLVAPIESLYAVSRAVQAGNDLRRCSTVDMPVELAAVATTLNDLLDARASREAMGRRAGARLSASGPPPDRMALLAVLDAVEHGVAVLDAFGAVVAANQAGLDALGALDRPTAKLAEAAESDADALPAGVRVTTLRDAFVRVDFDRVTPAT